MPPKRKTAVGKKKKKPAAVTQTNDQRYFTAPAKPTPVNDPEWANKYKAMKQTRAYDVAPAATKPSTATQETKEGKVTRVAKSRPAPSVQMTFSPTSLVAVPTVPVDVPKEPPKPTQRKSQKKAVKTTLTAVAPKPPPTPPALTQQFTEEQIAEAKQRYSDDVRQIDLRTRRPFSSIPATPERDSITDEDFRILASEFTTNYAGDFELAFQYSFFMWIVGNTRIVIHLKLQSAGELRDASQWVTERTIGHLVAPVSPNHLDNTYIPTRQLSARYDPKTQFLLMITVDAPRCLVYSKIMESTGGLCTTTGNLPMYYCINRFIVRCIGCNRAFQRFTACTKCQATFACIDQESCARVSEAMTKSGEDKRDDAGLTGRALISYHQKHGGCLKDRIATIKCKYEAYAKLLKTDSRTWSKLVRGELPVDLYSPPERQLETVTRALEKVHLNKEAQKRVDGAEEEGGTHLSDKQVLDIIYGLQHASVKRPGRRAPARRAQPTNLVDYDEARGSGGRRKKVKDEFEMLRNLGLAIARSGRKGRSRSSSSSSSSDDDD